MATRSIITSQPDVACEVCERRLLRGEQADIFLAAGRRRIVCELCAPRALNEGWRREADGDAVTLAPPRPRRGRSLVERLPMRFRGRQLSRPLSPAGELDAEGLSYVPDHEPVQDAPAPPYEQRPEPSQQEPHPYDFLGGLEIVDRKPGETDETSLASFPGARPASVTTAAERGIDVFNASEFPRRIAGIARSLGAPAVNVCQVEDTVGETVSIVVAWELCWYRYEVDLDEQAPAARLAAQGTELEELARGERHANTPVDELGLLSASAS
ncbi:MAG TPA: hypothetical protein VNZ01_00010 [Solirubrobacteraceae bacterium]|jgi:hypothetical protein|nr:hypothetical protein [Solirubrobacteraceae bacterium]